MTGIKTIVCKFTHAKETKGTHQYKATGDDYKIGTIYIRKSALDGDVPKEITATVEYTA